MKRREKARYCDPCWHWFSWSSSSKTGLRWIYASAAPKDDREFVLEAVKQDGRALYDASAKLQNGGLREYFNHLKDLLTRAMPQDCLLLYGAEDPWCSPEFGRSAMRVLQGRAGRGEGGDLRGGR